MALCHNAETATYLGPPGSDPDDDGATVIGRLFPGDQSVLDQLRQLPSRGGGIHVSQPGELADLQAFILLNAPQQLESRL